MPPVSKLHQDLVTHNTCLCWLENLMGEAIVGSSVMMIAIHTYIMFVSEPFQDMLSWWDKTWLLCSITFVQVIV